MKRQFVVGVFVERNRILLAKRSAGDPYAGQLWSLPGGGVETNEGSREALVREFREETNLEVEGLEELFSFTGVPDVLSELVVFLVSQASGVLKSNDEDIERLEFFEFDKVPEELEIQSLLSILEYQITRRSSPEHVSTSIDRVFAAIFYSYLNPELESFDCNDDAKLYKYIVLSTPYRKFKSVVPFLIAKPRAEHVHLFCVPELCYAIWTLLDDCYDERAYRYGVESARGRFGTGTSIIALFRAGSNLEQMLRVKIAASQIEAINSALIKSAELLYQRSLNNIDTDIGRYIGQSIERTEFLRTSWMIALEQAGCSAARVKLICGIQMRSSEVGQLINDYFDMVRGGLEDFDSRTASMHGLLLYKHADTDDRELLKSLWMRRSSGKADYEALLRKYDIEVVLRQMIVEKLDRIIEHVQASSLDSDDKTILLAWHQMSYIHFKSEGSGVELLSVFLRAVKSTLFMS